MIFEISNLLKYRQQIFIAKFTKYTITSYILCLVVGRNCPTDKLRRFFSYYPV